MNLDKEIELEIISRTGITNLDADNCSIILGVSYQKAARDGYTNSRNFKDEVVSNFMGLFHRYIVSNQHFNWNK